VADEDDGTTQSSGELSIRVQFLYQALGHVLYGIGGIVCEQSGGWAVVPVGDDPRDSDVLRKEVLQPVDTGFGIRPGFESVAVYVMDGDDAMSGQLSPGISRHRCVALLDEAVSRKVVVFDIVEGMESEQHPSTMAKWSDT